MEEEIFGAESLRAQVLWRVAYTFLRLDQLPSGGWSKTLANWMELIWKGDYGSIPRNPQMRTVGGTDLTTYTFYYYKLFLEKIFPLSRINLLLQHNRVADRVYDNFKEKVNFEGAVGGRRGLGVEPDVRVRHTLMGLITFLQYGKTHQGDPNLQEILSRTYNYLVEKIPDWGHDKSHLFAMTAAAIKLYEMLTQDVFNNQLTEGYQAEHLKDVLAQHIPDMMAAVSRPLDKYSPVPDGTIQGPLDADFFHPYYDFWRMERANFLMNFPFFITDDGQAFLPQVTSNIRLRFADIFSRLLKEIDYPYNENDPSVHLLQYHRNSNVPQGLSNWNRTVRDWGLSAELAVLLGMKSVREIVLQNTSITEEKFDQKRRVLYSALLRTFDHCHQGPDIFRFTHGSSFGRILHLFDKGGIKPQELVELDESITQLCIDGATEQGIMGLITNQVCSKEVERAEVKYRALKNFLVAKLKSGECTPDGHVCNKNSWENRVQGIVDESTINFYNSALGKQHADRWENDPERNLISEIQHRFEWQSGQKKTALDVGCGVGQYAALLAEMGFEVGLLDASEEMLRRAYNRLEISTYHPTTKNIFDVDWGYSASSFDLIFACAIMIHVPKERRNRVYSNFYRLMKPDGLLFVNYKIGDHTLISEDQRFFAYYRDESWPMTELENHGFRIEAMILNTKDRNMYQDRKMIRWVNFYCRKME